MIWSTAPYSKRPILDVPHLGRYSVYVKRGGECIIRHNNVIIETSTRTEQEGKAFVEKLVTKELAIRAEQDEHAEENEVLRVLTEIATQLIDSGRRITRIAENDDVRRKSNAQMQEAANELRGLFGNIRWDLLVKYGKD